MADVVEAIVDVIIVKEEVGLVKSLTGHLNTLEAGFPGRVILRCGDDQWPALSADLYYLYPRFIIVWISQEPFLNVFKTRLTSLREKLLFFFLPTLRWFKK